MEFLSISLTDIIGYGASLGVLVSFLMKDIRTLRIVNTVGCILFIAYGFLLHTSWPIIITNVSITCINIYYLTQPQQSK